MRWREFINLLGSAAVTWPVGCVRRKIGGRASNINSLCRLTAWFEVDLSTAFWEGSMNASVCKTEIPRRRFMATSLRMTTTMTIFAIAIALMIASSAGAQRRPILDDPPGSAFQDKEVVEDHGYTRLPTRMPAAVNSTAGGQALKAFDNRRPSRGNFYKIIPARTPARSASADRRRAFR